MAGSAAHPQGRGLERLPALCAAGCQLPRQVQRFYFLRHGQTARNALRIFQSVDEPLSATGLAQAEQAAAVLAEELADAGTVHIVCSDAPRARATAQALACRLGCEERPHSGLRERHFGALIGTSSANIDWDCAPEGGETLDQFVQRTLQALAEAVSHPEPVVVVAHGGTLHVLAAALGLLLPAGLLANATPLHFERQAGAWSVRRLGMATLDSAAPNLA